MRDGPRGGGACASSRIEATRHPPVKGQRASPGPAGVGKRPGWAAPRRLVDEWTALVLPTLTAGIHRSTRRAPCPRSTATGPSVTSHSPPYPPPDCTGNCIRSSLACRDAGERTQNVGQVDVSSRTGPADSEAPAPRDHREGRRRCGEAHDGRLGHRVHEPSPVQPRTVRGHHDDVLRIRAGAVHRLAQRLQLPVGGQDRVPRRKVQGPQLGAALLGQALLRVNEAPPRWPLPSTAGPRGRTRLRPPCAPRPTPSGSPGSSPVRSETPRRG